MGADNPLPTIEHLDARNGMSSDYVTSIAQDRHGFLWVGTEVGLNRFDGTSFKKFTTQNSPIIGNAVTSLLYDESGDRMWIGTKSGLSIYNCANKQFERPPLPSNAKTFNITALEKAPDGGIWVVNHYNHVIKYNPESGESLIISSENCAGLPDDFLSLLDDGTGHVYIGHHDNGMSIIDLKSLQLERLLHDAADSRSLPDNMVHKIYADHFHNIWVGTNGGLALYNPSNRKFAVFKHDEHNNGSILSDRIYDIFEMNDGKLWIGCDYGGVSIIDLRDFYIFKSAPSFKNISTSTADTKISSNNIRSLFQDSFGNIWVGNYSRGLDFISSRPECFRLIHTYNGDNSALRSVMSLCNGTDNSLWIGGSNAIYKYFPGKEMEKYDISHTTKDLYQYVTSICEYKDHLLCGLNSESFVRLRHNRVEDSKNLRLSSIYPDSNNYFYLGAADGLYKLEGDVISMDKSLSEQMYHLPVNSVLKDKNWRLWVGTYGDGIFIFDSKDSLLTRLHAREGFVSNAVVQIFQDSRGWIWIGCQDGLSCVKDVSHPEKYINYTHKSGINGFHIKAIAEDEKGNIWISTDAGVSKWDATTFNFENYDLHSGLPTTSFTSRAAATGSDGFIYFGSLDGVCAVNTRVIGSDSKTIKVEIADLINLSADNGQRADSIVSVAFSETVTLPYKSNSIGITFSIPDYSLSRQAEYMYMMEGLDDKWLPTFGENQVAFRNLPPGTYKFKICARQKNLSWENAPVTELKIVIEPPIWLTWYAISFYCLILVAAAYLLIRLYQRRLKLKNNLELERRKSLDEKELNNERLRFYTNITHELRTPLTLILGPLEDLSTDSRLPESCKEQIKMIHRSSLRLLNLINQILEFRKTETSNRKLTVTSCKLSELVSEIGLQYKELNRKEKVSMLLDIEPSSSSGYYDRDIIGMIVNNLLSNAVKYTDEGEIKLSLRETSIEGFSYEEITVSDTGYGIDSKSLPHIFDRYYQAEGKHQASGTGIGLALVKSLVNLHEGTVEVKSCQGKGTTFYVRFIKGNTYPDALHKEQDNVKKDNGSEEQEDAEDTANQPQDIRPLVLVVEDNEDIRDYISTSLKDMYRIITADNGKEGTETALKDIPDIIVSDIMMPVMDGIELCRRIKQDIRTSHVPVILLTAKDTINDKELGYETGADSYITKPFSAKMLNSRIHNLLETRRILALKYASLSHSNQLSEDIQEKNAPKLNKLDEAFLNDIRQIIMEHIDSQDLDIKYLCDKMGMSQSTLYRKLKGLTDMSGNEFIRKVRLQYCRTLLDDGYNVSNAAYTSGFNDIGHFRTCFKEEYGLTPSQYIKQNISCNHK